MHVAESVYVCVVSHVTVQSYCHTCIQRALEQVMGELTAETRLSHTWGLSGLHIPDSGGRSKLNEQ